jgi:hypothetical protein
MYDVKLLLNKDTFAQRFAVGDEQFCGEVVVDMGFFKLAVTN